MAIEINPLGPNNNGKPKITDAASKASNKAVSENAHPAEASSSQGEGTNVELSGTGVLMQKFEEKINQASDTDLEKVQHYQQLINSGQYTVNAQSVAQKMLDSDNSL